MHTARMRIVPVGGREGGVVTWSWGGGREVLSPGPRGGGRCCHLVPGEGGRCCHLAPRGREGGVVTWSWGRGGVVTWLQGGEGGRCCHLVPGGGRCCLLVRGGGRCCDLVAHPPPPPQSWTDRCLWKHNLRSLRYAGGNKPRIDVRMVVRQMFSRWDSLYILHWN